MPLLPPQEKVALFLASKEVCLLQDKAWRRSCASRACCSPWGCSHAPRLRAAGSGTQPSAGASGTGLGAESEGKAAAPPAASRVTAGHLLVGCSHHQIRLPLARF